MHFVNSNTILIALSMGLALIDRANANTNISGLRGHGLHEYGKQRKLSESAPYFAFGEAEAYNLGWREGSYTCEWKEVCTLNEDETEATAQHDLIIACRACKKACAGAGDVKSCKNLCKEEYTSEACSLTSIVDTAPITPGQDNGEIANRGDDGTCPLPSRNAPFPLTDCNDWQPILAPDGTEGKKFGSIVSIDGDWIAVGAHGDSGGKGAVYMFRKVATGTSGSASGFWKFHQKLKPIAGRKGDEYTFCDLSGDTLAVGAKRSDYHGVDSGAAYVYRLNPAKDKWILEAKIVPSDGAALDFFGNNLAVHGSSGKLLVGARLHNTEGHIDAGAVYAYYRHDDQWGGEEKIIPDPSGSGASEAGDQFGARIMFDDEGESAIITAHKRDAFGPNSGAAYVFKHRQGRGWRQEQILTPNDGIRRAEFGVKVRGKMCSMAHVEVYSSSGKMFDGTCNEKSFPIRTCRKIPNHSAHHVNSSISSHNITCITSSPHLTVLIG